MNDAESETSAGRDVLVEQVEAAMRRTFDHRVIEADAEIGAAFSLESRLSIFARRYRRPVLMGATSSGGAKQQLAIALKRHDPAGRDIVALCVNDLVARAAEPLFFMAYVGSCHVDADVVAGLVDGIAAACLDARCAFVGVRSVERSELLRPGQYDMVGFAVGVAAHGRLVNNERLQAGDAIIGLGASGVCSCGYAEARDILMDRGGLTVSSSMRHLGIDATVGEELHRPTDIYARAVRTVLAPYRVKRVVTGMFHVTDGGLMGAMKALLCDGFSMQVQLGSWPEPEIFRALRSVGRLDQAEMMAAFNMGLGFLMTIRPAFAGPAIARLKRLGQPAWVVGSVVEGNGDVLLLEGGEPAQKT